MCVSCCACVLYTLSSLCSLLYNIASLQTKKQASRKMSFSQPFPLFQSPISSPAAAAANRRVARAPPGTKTARHGRTNMPQNRTEKVPNVRSEFLEKMSFSNLFRFFNPISPPAAAAAANRRVARAPPGTKTARHGRTHRP